MANDDVPHLDQHFDLFEQAAQGGPAMPAYVWTPAPKFQHRYWLHIVLFVVTLVSATFAPLWEFVLGGQFGLLARLIVAQGPQLVAEGLKYSVPMLLILGAHEFGHYFACRYHNVDATLPYFIPAPLPLTGTAGAVIRIREAFPSKQALFDIGVAGPIAGFVALLPFLFWGVAHSTLTAVSSTGDNLKLGDPLLLKFVERLVVGPIPPRMDLMVHPTAFAAWFGMFATALNLLPFGQLDGGHIAYAVAGKRAVLVSVATLVVTVSLTFWSASWIVTSIMLVAMALVIGVRHPRIVDEATPLDPTRTLVAIFALVMFILCFTPVPIETFWGR